MEERNLASKIVAIYVGMMVVTMVISNYVFGYQVGNLRRLKVVLSFEFIMTVFAIFSYRVYFERKGYKNFLTINLSPLFNIFSIGILATFVIFLSTANFSGNWEIFGIMAGSTLLIGISEELIFRGILLDALLKKHSVLGAVFFSAIYFSLFHAASLLGGLSFHAIVIQLLASFIYGIVVACFAIQIKNIFPLMMFHWMWDLMGVAINIVGSKAGPGILAISILGIVTALFSILAVSYNDSWND